MVKEISLQNGMVAFVDDEDHERVSQYNWGVTKDGDTSLKVSSGTSGICREFSSLQRFILQLKIGDEKIVIFKDGDQLNFQKNNLVVGDRKMQSLTRRAYRNSSSKYKGVRWDKRNSIWMSEFTIDGKRKHLGSFKCEDDAARAYNNAVLKIHGEWAYQNIIGEDNRAVAITIEKQKKTTKERKLKGVSEFLDKWVASIKIKNERVYLGTFDTPEQAARAYDKKAYQLHRDKARLNFPKEYKKSI